MVLRLTSRGFYTDSRRRVRPVTSRTRRRVAGGKKIPFSTYDEALAFIAERAKSFPSRNAYLASDEYHALYPEVMRLRDADLAVTVSRFQRAMKEAGIKAGDQVERIAANPFGQVFVARGTVRMGRDGLPYVHTTLNEINGKKRVLWKKWFRKVT